MNFKKITLSLLVFTAFHFSAHADDPAAVPAPAPAAAPAPATEVKAASYSELLQKKYSLTEAEAKSLSDSKLGAEHQTRVAALARASGKTVDEVLNMRLTDKMGWGKIAKTLGVHPGELGKAVSEMKREQKSARNAEFKEKQRVQKEKRDADKAAKLEEKRKVRDNRVRPDDKAKPAHEERGNGRGNGKNK